MSQISTARALLAALEQMLARARVLKDNGDGVLLCARMVSEQQAVVAELERSARAAQDGAKRRQSPSRVAA
jgi:hypothetical protein